MPRTLSAARLRAAALALSLLAAFAVVGTATPADAASYQSRLLAEAAKHKGKPYQYGAAGPSRFDCSGFTKYVFGRLGRALPRTSSDQYRAVKRIPKSQRAPGDLLFFPNSSGRITHVAIYAGHGNMWHASRSGSNVKLAKVYTSNHLVGRF